jgi:opacity protein-like surface antigen
VTNITRICTYFEKLLILSVAAVMPLPATAQDWEYSVSPYLWAPSIKTTVDNPLGESKTDTSFSGLFDALNAGAMLAAEARKGKWGIIGDLLYLNLESFGDTPFDTGFDGTRTTVKGGQITGYVAYRLHEDERVTFDLLGGARYWSLDTDVRFNAGLLPEENVGGTESWFDPVVGAQAQFKINEKWDATVRADYGSFGGGGAKQDWQAIGIVGYRLNDKWSLEGGYRYWELEKQVGELDVDLKLSGPIFGATYRF